MINRSFIRACILIISLWFSILPKLSGQSWTFNPIYTQGYCIDDENRYLPPEGQALIVGGDGEVYIAGNFYDSADFDPSSKQQLLSSKGYKDIFLARYSEGGELEWSFSFGGTEYDKVWAMRADKNGNLYIAGSFSGRVDFNPTKEESVMTSNGLTDGFIASYNSNGEFRWVTSFGGAEVDDVKDIAIAPSGHLIVVGSFKSEIDLDPSNNHKIIASQGRHDGFISKYSLSGDFIWGQQLASNFSCYAQAVAVDDHNSIYLTGVYKRFMDLKPGSSNGTIQSVNNGYEVYLVKYKESGNLEWYKTYTGNNLAALDIAVDHENNIGLLGFFADSIFFQDQTRGKTIYPKSPSSTTSFVTKLSTDGQLLWFNYWGGKSRRASATSQALTFDKESNLFITGSFKDSVYLNKSHDPMTTAGTIYHNPNEDILLIKFDSEGDYEWSRSMGGKGADRGYAVASGQKKEVFVTGYYYGFEDCNRSNLPIVPVHLYLVKFDKEGEYQ